MNGATINNNNEALVVSGAINFNTVVPLRQLGASLIKEINKPIIDFKGVTQCNSTGLALMMAWKRAAKEAHKTIQFVNVPPSLLSIADVCDVSEILGLTVNYG
mgnify:FL=1